ncbi:MAG: integrin alpha [Pseudomonadota bacterium]
MKRHTSLPPWTPAVVTLCAVAIPLLPIDPAEAQGLIDLTGASGANSVQLSNTSTSADRLGQSVSGTGDVNGDGFDDVIFGAPQADGGLGEVYVMFGSAAPTAALATADLDGSNGFRISNGTLEFSLELGLAVTGGADLTGDGRDDLAFTTDNSTNGRVYVLPGQIGAFPASVTLGPSLPIGIRQLVTPFTGERVSALAIVGDVNDDTPGDLLIGSQDASGGNSSGQGYVAFGPVASSVSLGSLSGLNGFEIPGFRVGDLLGTTVAAAGNFNNDSFDDLILGAPGDATTSEDAAYLLYGFSDSTVSSRGLNFSFGDEGGFAMRANAADEANVGVVGTAGDLNGDGFDDLFVGAPGATTAGVYVVFGQAADYPPALDLASLDGSNGFRINDVAILGQLGEAVSAIGDINGDGFDDLAIGDPNRGPGDLSIPGVVYVVFGAATFPAELELSDLSGSNGFVVEGPAGNQRLGAALAGAGDFNNDGLDDLVIGAPQDGGGRGYVLLGNSAPRSLEPALALAPTLEDSTSDEVLLSDLLGPVYVDAEPLAGVAVIDNPFGPFQGSWQFNNGGPWFPLSTGQTESSATVLTAATRLRYVPVPDFAGGPIRLQLRLWDGNWGMGGDNRDIRDAINALGGFGDVVSVEIIVTPVNDRPTLLVSDPPRVLAGAGPQLLPGFASLNPGGGETAQTGTYQFVSLTNPQLFLDLPSIDSNGDLTYTPNEGSGGTSEVQFVVQDSGGTTNGGEDTSQPVTVTFTILDTFLFADSFED